MKKNAIYLMLIALCLGASINSPAQDKEQIDKKVMLQEVKKEKLKTPIKIADAIRNQELELQAATKKSRATDTKLTTNNSATVDEGESFIAMDPSNNNNMVLSYMQNNSSSGITYPIYYSSNAGQSWTRSSFNALTYLAQSFPGALVAGGGDPVFAYDKTGKLFFSWIYLVFDPAKPDTAFAAMFMANSNDNGQTWSIEPGKDRFIGLTAIDVSTFESYGNYEGMYDRQWFAMDLTNGANANTLYCSFVYFPNMIENPNLTGQYIKSKPPTALKFNSTKKQVNVSESQFGNVAVTADGKLHTTYAEVSNGKVMHAVSSDGGNTFSTPHLIANGTNLFGSQGNGYIHDRENSAVNLAAGGNVLHVVWSDFPLNPGANYNSFYANSTDGGNTWSTPLNLSTIFGTTNKAFMPTVCAYNNRVSIGAYIISAGKVAEFKMVGSYDDGANWNTPVLLSTQFTNFSSPSNTGKWFGDYSNAVRNQDNSYFIWSDGRGTSGPKMYLSVVSEWATGVTEITPINGHFSLEKYYPNPVQHVLTLEIKSDKNDQLNIQLSSMDGKIINEQLLTIGAGTHKLDISTHSLASGNYLLKISNTAGEHLSRLIHKD